MLIDQYAGSSVMGMEIRPFAMAREWAKGGDDVTLVLGSFSHLRRKNPDVTCGISTWTEEGVRFCVLPTPVYQRNDIRRAINVIVFIRQLNQAARTLANRYAPNVVVASSTHPFDFGPARRIAAFAKATVVFELHDLWPLSPIELYHFSPFHPLMRLIDKSERHAFSKADAVVSVLPCADRFLAEQHITPRRYLHIPNGSFGCAPTPPPQSHCETLRLMRQRFGFLVLYAGGFSAANAVADFIALAHRMPHIAFAAVGDGPEKAYLTPLAHENHNLCLLDSVTPGALATLLSQADVLWPGTRDLTIYRYGLAMNKLFDYMLAARPVLLAVHCDDTPISSSGCGITVPPGDIEAMCAALQSLRALSLSDRDAMGMCGRRYVLRRHSYPLLAAQFKILLEELSHAPI
ncbi:MAG: glycosyltransferase family 4 protein [Oscillospiraceae bacterium]